MELVTFVVLHSNVSFTQVEYAMEAVKQGSATVGLKSSTHAVLVALKRASSELAAHQKKIKPLDEHIAVSISGNFSLQSLYQL